MQWGSTKDVTDALCRTCRENIGNCGIMKGSCSGCITCVGTILKCPNDKYSAKGERE